MASVRNPISTSTRKFVLLLLALAALLPLTDLLVVKIHGPQIEREAYANLAAIAKLKADQIENWLQERSKDSQMLSGNPDFARHVAHLLAPATPTESQRARSAIAQQLAQLRQTYQYQSIDLLDLRTRVLVASDVQVDPPLSLGVRMLQMQDSGQAQRLDFQTNAQGQVYISWLVPVFDPSSPVRQPMAAVLLTFLPEHFLFPVIQTWPTSSPSGETLLVTREGNMAVFLNTLRHVDNTAMKLRLPLSQTNLPAAVALQSTQPGTVLGADHQGTAVLAAYRPVADTDWRVVAKISQSEVMEPVYILARWISAVTALALAALLVVLWLFWRQHRHTQELELRSEKNKSNELLERFYSLPFLGIASGDLVRGQWGRFNDHFCTIVGCTPQQLPTLAWSALVDATDWQKDLRGYAQLVRGDIEAYAVDRRIRRADGSEVYVEMQLRVLASPDDSPPRCIMMLQDITRRHAAECRIKRQTQLYAALSACNQAIVQCQSQEQLFTRICESVVAQGGLSMAWIGLHDAATPSLRLAAAHGMGAQALRQLPDITPDNARAWGAGSAATALQDQRAVWGPNSPGSPGTAAIPLHQGDATVGVFVLVADAAHAFDQDAQNLLQEIASDVDFALGNFEREAQRRHTVSLLHHSQTQLELALKGSSDAPWDWNLLTNTLEYSPQGWHMLGYGANDIPTTAQLWHVLIHPLDMPQVQQLQRQLLRSNDSSTSMELRLRHRDGHYVPVLSRGFVTRDERGIPVRVTGTNMDLTAQYQSQHIEALRPMTLELIASDLDVAHILQALVHKLCELLPGTAAASWLLGSSHTTLLLRAVTSELAPPLEQAHALQQPASGTDVPGSVAFSAPESRKLVLANSPLREQLHRLLQATEWAGVWCVPILSGAGRVMGVLDLHQHPNQPPGSYALRLLNEVTQLVALAVEERAAQEQQRLAAQVFSQSHEGITITDAQANILLVNPAFSTITGYSTEEVLGHNPRILSSGRQDKAFYAQLWHSVTQEGFWQGEIWNRRKNGEVYPEWLAISQMKDAQGEVTNYVAVFSDITARKSADEQIRNLAFYDPLTSLPNRRCLMDRLEQAQAASERHRRQGALLCVDLDNFKTINDTLGHHQGDLLLKQVAKRLSTCVREEDTVARLGADEFVVLLENLSDTADGAAHMAETVAEKIQATLSQDYQLSGQTYHSTPSIGITLFGDEQYESVDEPLKRADLAMYQAKAAGRNALRFFDPQMQAAVEARATLEQGLREAVRENQFVLYYQAQVGRDARITGFEALVRWCHPTQGIVPPGAFIAVAEESGLILPLGQWVLEAAAMQLVAWATQPAMAHLSVAVNVSARQFYQIDFVQQVLAVLERTGAPAHRLKLELTESLLVDNIENVIAKMEALKAQGVGFSLDDFGTGYSSLSYLKRLPLDQLKIDQSFVRDLLTDPNDVVIARTIVALGHSLGLSVIAEGVETAEQRDLLASMGCDAFQGYFFARPVAAEALVNL